VEEEPFARRDRERREVEDILPVAVREADVAKLRRERECHFPV
jgi:hypothetical protein